MAEAAGPIRHLGEALRRRREGATVYSVDQQTALDVLTAQLTDVSAELAERVLDAAHVLIIHAAEPGNQGSDLAAAWLENVLVPYNAGATAFDALYKRMHVDAGKAYVTSPRPPW